MKVKKLLSLLAAATMTVTTFTGTMSVSAVEVNGKLGDNLTWTLDANGKLTISGKGEMASPDNNLDNSGDEFKDFYTYKKYKDDIKEVIIEKGVTSIGFCAFYKFPNLKTVVIPSTINDWGGNDKSNNEYAGMWDVYNYAFAECPLLKNVTLSEGMTRLGGYAFANCTSLESINIPSTVEKWGRGTFCQCSSLKNVKLKEGIIVIGAEAFAETALESVVIPSTVKYWPKRTHRDRNLYLNNDNYAFVNCIKLSSVTFSDGLQVIAGCPFAGCSSLKKVGIPGSIRSMIFAFANCNGIEEAYIEDGANLPLAPDWDLDFSTEMSFQNAFSNCENLKRLEIPAGVEIDYNDAQWCQGCSSLTDVYLHGKDYNSNFIPIANSKESFHCYDGSSTYDTLLQRLGILMSSKIISIEEDISNAQEELNAAVSEAEKYSEKDYTAESYGKLKALLDKAEKFGDDPSVLAMEFTSDGIREAIKGLEKKPVNTPSNSQQQTPNKTTPNTPTTARPTKSTRSAAQVKKDKSAAKKAMKQAKITKLTAKSKAKKKIAVSWKKVKNAKGYQVQVSAKNNFKKVIYNKNLTKNKLTIKSSKIKSKKTYYVRVRAYATYKDANNATKKIYSKWVKKIRKVKAK